MHELLDRLAIDDVLNGISRCLRASVRKRRDAVHEKWAAMGKVVMTEMGRLKEVQDDFKR